MPDYSQINLKEVKDQAKGFGLEGMEARFPHQELGAGLSYQKYEPNTRIPFGHQHEEAEEIYVVVKGSGRMKLDDEIVELKEWDALRIAPPGYARRGGRPGWHGAARRELSRPHLGHRAHPGLVVRLGQAPASGQQHGDRPRRQAGGQHHFERPQVAVQQRDDPGQGDQEDEHQDQDPEQGRHAPTLHTREAAG